MSVSKTNPQAGGRSPGRKTSMIRKRYLGDKEVKPAWYHGSREGHGNYMGGHVDDRLVEDANGKPLPFKQIGELR